MPGKTKKQKERRSNTKIQLVSMTLAPKPSTTEAKPVSTQTTVASEGNVTSLWGGRTVDEASDPWNQSGGLPDLPGQYGSAPELEEAPF